MSILAETKIKLGETQSLIATYEQALAEHPEHAGMLAISISSLQKMMRQLDREFATAVASLGLDVCRYRLIPEDGTAKITSVMKAVSSFQTFVSVVYDAIENGPKERARLAADVVDATSFEFGYSFVGSVGIVLTIPNERLLTEEFATKLDESIAVVFEIAKSASPEEIGEYAKRYGHAVVRAFRAWTLSHVEAGFGVDARWSRGEASRAQLAVQYPEFRDMCRSIDETSAETTSEFEAVGELTKVDMDRRRFRLKVEDAEQIEGTFTDAVTEEHSASVPMRYHARVAKTVTAHYALDTDKVYYHLLELRKSSP